MPKYAETLLELHGTNWEMLLQKTAAMMLQLGANPTFKNSDFETIETPILVGVGDKDVMVSLEETIQVCRSLPNAQLLVMPNTIHPIDRINLKLLTCQIRNFFL